MNEPRKVPDRFGPESFRPLVVSAWVVSAKFDGSFRPDFFLSPLGKVGQVKEKCDEGVGLG